jgi:hypothetical protein
MFLQKIVKTIENFATLLDAFVLSWNVHVTTTSHMQHNGIQEQW